MTIVLLTIIAILTYWNIYTRRQNNQKIYNLLKDIKDEIKRVRK